MMHNEITEVVVDTALDIHRRDLRLTNLQLGLLLNFGSVLMKDGIYRIANGLENSEE